MSVSVSSGFSRSSRTVVTALLPSVLFATTRKRIGMSSFELQSYCNWILTFLKRMLVLPFWGSERKHLEN